MSESQEQQALFEWAAYQAGKWPELRWMYHIPNEGLRNPRTGARLKKEGLKPGVPDICLPVPRGGYHGLFIELKAGKNKPTETQIEWLQELVRQGYAAGWCTGWEQAAEMIKRYMEGKL